MNSGFFGGSPPSGQFVPRQSLVLLGLDSSDSVSRATFIDILAGGPDVVIQYFPGIRAGGEGEDIRHHLSVQVGLHI